MGRKDIAEFLISKGPRIDIFAAAMLDKLDIVNAMTAAYPGIEHSFSPHRIALLAHAKSDNAEAVVGYLSALLAPSGGRGVDTVGPAMLQLSIFLLVGALLSAAEFKSPKECVLGLKVADREKLTGKVLSVDSSTCYVQMDGTGKKGVYLFWMLHAAGGSAATDDKLLIGKYECWVGSNMTGGMEITSPATYSSDGKSGKFRVEASRKIVFESGPYSSYSAKLLPGPRIGMNLSGGTFYNMTCDPVKK